MLCCCFKDACCRCRLSTVVVAVVVVSGLFAWWSSPPRCWCWFWGCSELAAAWWARLRPASDMRVRGRTTATCCKDSSCVSIALQETRHQLSTTSQRHSALNSCCRPTSLGHCTQLLRLLHSGYAIEQTCHRDNMLSSATLFTNNNNTNIVKTRSDEQPCGANINKMPRCRRDNRAMRLM